MYTPGIVPQEPAALAQYLSQELRNIASAMASPVFILSLAPSHKEPDRLTDGMVVLADGTDWDPGSGAGFYGYRDGAWRPLE